MHFHGAITKLTGEGNDLGNDEFCDAARVAEGRVEDADAMLGGVLEVHLVRADTEASDHE